MNRQFLWINMRGTSVSESRKEERKSFRSVFSSDLLRREGEEDIHSNFMTKQDTEKERNCWWLLISLDCFDECSFSLAFVVSDMRRAWVCHGLWLSVWTLRNCLLDARGKLQVNVDDDDDDDVEDDDSKPNSLSTRKHQTRSNYLRRVWLRIHSLWHTVPICHHLPVMLTIVLSPRYLPNDEDPDTIDSPGK